MAEKDKVFYWIKLRKEFMNSETIDFLMSQKNGANYVVLYQMLIMQTLNTEGKLCNVIGECIVPFNAEKIQRDCKWFDIDTVRVAMELYAKLGLIYKNEDDILTIADFDNMVGSETYWAKIKRIEKLKKEEFKYIKKLSNEQFVLPNGEKRFIDEKRYGGNGMFVWDRSQGKCEICGSTENLCIHHNNGYSNNYEDLVIVCRSCHRDIEEGKKSWKFSNEYPTNVQNPLISNISNLKSNNIDNNIERDNIKEKEPTHKYGEYGWIKLTDTQYNKLCEEYTKDYIDFAIKQVDEYVQSTNNKNKYKDWNLVLRRAIRDNWSCLNGKNRKTTTAPNALEKTTAEIEKEYEEWNKQHQAEIDELGF